ncbi:hypothetical protein F5148DRAFT_627584 [Russula earlei]|uniref:Uncharacterized protein n=1 Tax=Russula earlei TaxID=71964 RepID=A0ACC0TUN0_9AGAM|nr:hypothetical protein F5148DRAFT_627584 [Russula earlei]
MPKEIRKRGRRHKKRATPVLGQGLQDKAPFTKPSWILSSTDSNSKAHNPEAPFGYVDPELKAYFRTVDDQLKEWQQNLGEPGAEEDVDSAPGFSLSFVRRSDELNCGREAWRA